MGYTLTRVIEHTDLGSLDPRVRGPARARGAGDRKSVV